MKENESMESHQERKELYELNSIRDESLHIQPYADMIDKLTYVQKADFAKRAIELERDCATYKKMFEEVSRERNAWISEYRAAREEVERLKQERKQIIETCASQALRITEYENQWQPSKQEQIDQLSEKFDQLDEEYQDLVRICTYIYKLDAHVLKAMVNESLGGDNFEKFKDHLGV